MRTLVDDPSLQLRVLVSGPTGALDHDVAWVHNTELLDPSPYVRPRELVLTNGLWHVGPESSVEFVVNVVRAGAAGVVFGLRRQTPRAPEDLVTACRDAGLPLLQISTAVPFTAVTQAVAATYALRRQDALVGLVRRGDALAEAISRGTGAVGVLRLLRRDHDLPLAVVDRAGTLLGAEGATLGPDQLARVAAGLVRHPPPLEIDLGDAVNATIFLVNVLGEVDAALVCLRPASRLSEAEHGAFQQAARFLSLEVARHQAVQAIESRFAGELLDMILSGAQRAAEVPGRLRAFGIGSAEPMAVLALAPAADSESGEVPPGLAEAVNQYLVTDGVRAVVAGGTRDVVAVLSCQRHEDQLTDIAERLTAAVEARFPGRRFVTGIGGVAPDASGLRQTLIAAREACRVLQARRGSARVAEFAGLSTYRLLLGLHDREALRRYAEGVLTPVRQHDRQRGGELETTLRAFLDNHGHWGDTARATFIHVNTLRNRLARIAELTGLDIGRTADRVDLFLALEADSMARDA
jgi:PucR family transcriptional regulator, purine catabolism regulatory protein